MESVRTARAADLPRCVELVAAARDEATTVRGGALLAALGDQTTGTPRTDGSGDRTDPARVVESWVAGGPTRILLIGIFEGATVGLATGHVVERGTRRIGRVDCCYVEAGARQVGVGGLLVEGLLEWFVTRQCSDVDAIALPGDRETKQLLETAGFKARLLVLHRPLG